jgi:adenosylhomocysteine nucleosidase
MLALLGAIKQEIADLLRQMVVEEIITWQHCLIYRGKYGDSDVLLVQTGIGKERAERATRYVLARYPITSLLSFGFAGALTEKGRVGDVVICSKLYRADGLTGQDLEFGETYFSTASLISSVLPGFEGAPIRFYHASSVTVPQLVVSPEVKRQLGEAFAADIVDMESYWIARIAAERGIPFIAVRAISDRMQDSLLPLEQILTSSGEWQWKRGIIFLLFHPNYWGKLVIVYRHAREARRSLGIFLSHLLSSGILK